MALFPTATKPFVESSSFRFRLEQDQYHPLKNGGNYGDDGCLSPSALISSRDINFDLSKATKLHCCNLFNYYRPFSFNPLVLRG